MHLESLEELKRTELFLGWIVFWTATNILVAFALVLKDSHIRVNPTRSINVAQFGQGLQIEHNQISCVLGKSVVLH
jgi:hypothetical protein